MLLEEFLLYLKALKLENRLSFTKDELYKAFNAGATAAVATIGVFANDLADNAKQVVHNDRVILP